MASRFEISCPIPPGPEHRVLMAHGGGGRKSQQLIADLFGAAFDDPVLHHFDDAARVPGDARIALATDSYVVTPLEFPGGDIGSMAVHGTVNDLAMAGARARYLTVAFILEEGLELERLWRIVRSMADTAAEAGVRIVAGDTKVVERGRAEGLYINTTGVGVLVDKPPAGPAHIADGAAVLLSGDIGRHGISVMSRRAELGFDSPIESDSGLLHDVALELCGADVELYCMRDLTRGGLASALVELAESSGVEIEVAEELIAVDEGVRGACELLGFDPMYVANEGRFVAFVAESDVDRALEVMRRHPIGASAARIGHATVSETPRVVCKTALGSRRLVEMFSGEQLPRIC